MASLQSTLTAHLCNITASATRNSCIYGTHSWTPISAMNWWLLPSLDTGEISSLPFFLWEAGRIKSHRELCQGCRVGVRDKNVDLLLLQIITHLLCFMAGCIVMQKIDMVSSQAGRLGFLSELLHNFGQHYAFVASRIHVLTCKKHIYSNSTRCAKEDGKYP